MAIAGMRVRYWGVTGSFANPLLPQQVRSKILESLQLLCADEQFVEGLRTHRPGSVTPQWLAEQLDRVVPFALRSTYGGNTTCVEVETSKALVIIDAGTGLRRLGEQLMRRWQKDKVSATRTVHVLLTHAHMDHTFATPFVEPYYDGRNRFILWAPDKVLHSLHAVLSPSSALRSTYFPPTYDSLEGIKQFRAIEPGATLDLDGLEVQTYALCHPGDCVAYRLNHESHSFVFATDHEHEQAPDEGLAEFARDADIFYSDAQFLESEYRGTASIDDEPPTPRMGWGHSTVEDTVATALAAGVRQLHLGHHDPKRSDVQLSELEAYAQQLTQQRLQAAGRDAGAMQTFVAREGMEVVLE